MVRRNDTEGKFKGFSSLATDEDCTEEGVGKDVKDKKIVYMALPIVLYSEWSKRVHRPTNLRIRNSRMKKIKRIFK
jgi:hypothetical protein